MSHKEILGLHRITKKHLKELCKKHRLYQTPHLNDQLYLHYQGFQAIENLEEYTGLKCLWLESNAISEIQGLESLTELKCLFLQNNLISKIENLQCCPELDTLNLASNHITRIENCGVDVLPVLSTLNLSRNYLRNSGGLQELVNCTSLWSLDLANNRIDDILVVKIFASMPELRVLVLQGNPVVSQVPQYRKTLILECKNLTYLDSRPVFPKDRACAEAWKRGGYEEERKEHDRWIRMDRKKIRDSVNATLRLRQKHGDADVQLLESTDEEDDGSHKKKKRRAILDKSTPDLEITGVDRSEDADKNPGTSNELSDTTSAAMAESSTSLQATDTVNSNEEEADNTLPELIQSDDMPAEKEDPKVSKSAEVFEEHHDESMDVQSDEKLVEEENEASDTKLQSVDEFVDKLDDVGEKSIQQPTNELFVEHEEVKPLEPAASELQYEGNTVEPSADGLKDEEPVEREEDVEMEPNQDLSVSQDHERAASSGSEPDLQEVLKACIAKSSRYNPVLMKNAPAFSKEPTAWKRFNSSSSSSGSDLSSSSDLSSDEGDTSDVSEDMTNSDRDTNISEPKDVDFKSLDEDQVVSNEETVPTETGVETSNFAVGDVKNNIDVAEPAEAAVKVPDLEAVEVKESIITIEPSDMGMEEDKPSIPDEPTATEMEPSNVAVGDVKNTIDLAESIEVAVELPGNEAGEVKPSAVTVGPSDMEMEEDKPSIPDEPTEAEIEPSNVAVGDVKNTIDLAETIEFAVELPGNEAGEVKPSAVTVEPSDMGMDEDKPSIPDEPTEAEMEPSNFAVGDVKNTIDLAESTEVAVELLGIEAGEINTSVVIVGPSDMEMEEDKPSIPDEPTEAEIEPSNVAVGDVKNTIDLAETIEFAVELPGNEAGEVKPSAVTVEPSDMGMDEDKPSIPDEPTEAEMEPSNFAVGDVKNTIDLAESTEVAVELLGIEAGEINTSVVIVGPSDMEMEEDKPSIPDEPTEAEMEPSNVAVGDVKNTIDLAESTEVAVELPGIEAGEINTSVVIVGPSDMEMEEDKPSIPDEPTEAEMEPSNVAVGDVKNTIDLAESIEVAVELPGNEAGEVKPSAVAVEPSHMESDEDKPSIPDKPTEAEMEPSSYPVDEVKNTVDDAEPTEVAVEVPAFEVSEVKASGSTVEEAKPSIPVEPTEVEVEPSNLAVDEVKNIIDDDEPTELIIEEQDFQAGKVKASAVTVKPSDMGMEEDKPSIPHEPIEVKMEPSDLELGEVINTSGFVNLTRSGTIDLFAMELTNDTLNNLYSDMRPSPMDEVQEFEEETTADREDTMPEHVDLQESTLEDRETLNQSFKSDHDTLDTTNWSFTEPDDTMPESLIPSDEKDTFDADNSQAIDLSEEEDSGLVSSFQTACISSDLENQDRATSVEDSEEQLTPTPDESSSVALAGLADILSQVCPEEEEKAASLKEPSPTQASEEVELIKKGEPVHADNKRKVTEDPEVSSWLESFLTAVRKREEKIRQTSIKEKVLDDIKEVDEDLTQLEAGSSNKPDTKNLAPPGQELTTSTVKRGDQRTSAVKDKSLSEKNSGPAWLQDVLKSLREKEEETEGDNTVIHKGDGLFSKIESLSEQLHLERSNNEKSAFKETEDEKTGTWVRLQIEEYVEDATLHSEGQVKNPPSNLEEASSNGEENASLKSEDDLRQYTDESSEEKCEFSEEGTGISHFSEHLTMYAASLDAEQRSKYRPDLAADSASLQVPSTTAEPEPVVEESLTWWQQTLAAAQTVKESKPSNVPEEPIPPANNEDTEQKRRFEEEFSENQTLEEKAEAFRLLETVLAATRREEIESLLIEPEVKQVVNELMEEDTKSTSSSDSSYHEEPQETETKPALTLRQVLDSFNAIQETVALRTQQRSQRIKELIDNPLTKEFYAQSPEDINRQVEEMKMDQRKRINDMIDKVYAQKDKYNDTLEVVDGRLMVVKRGTGALEEVPPPPSSKYSSSGVSTDQTGEPSSKYVSCGVSTSQTQDTSKYSSCGSSTDQSNNTQSKYTSCGSSTDQSNNTSSKYSSCGSSTDQTDNAPSKYSSCGSSTDQSNNTSSKYSSCGASTDQIDNIPSKYSSCGVSSQTQDISKYSSCGASTDQTDLGPSKYTSCGGGSDQTDNIPSKYSSWGVASQTQDASRYTSCDVSTSPPSNRNDSESDDYGTALSDEAANDDDDGCDIEQHASDTKIRRIPYFVAGCSTMSQSSSSISREGDEEDTANFECNNEQQYESLRKVQQLHKDIDEQLFIKASKWMEDGVEIPPMQPPVLEKRKGKEEEMLLKNYLGQTIETNEIPPELYNELQSFMDFDEEALEDISLIFDTPDEG